MTSTSTNLVRRVVLDGFSPRFNIGLMLENSSAQVVNSIRRRYSPPGIQLPTWTDTRLFYGILGKDLKYCQRILTGHATRYSPFALELKSVTRSKQPSGRHVIKVKIVSHEMMKLRDRIRRELGSVLDEAARRPTESPGIPAATPSLPPGCLQPSNFTLHAEARRGGKFIPDL
jgi:hypothetical protein